MTRVKNIQFGNISQPNGNVILNTERLLSDDIGSYFYKDELDNAMSNLIDHLNELEKKCANNSNVGAISSFNKQINDKYEEIRNKQTELINNIILILNELTKQSRLTEEQLANLTNQLNNQRWGV